MFNQEEIATIMKQTSDAWNYGSSSAHISSIGDHRGKAQA